jgi:adenylosuccinate synthase
MQQGKFNIIIGGQAGSESKGKLSGWLCDKYKPDLLVMTSSPNAGHTVVTPEGEKKVSYHLPIGAVMCDCPIVLGPASLINFSILQKEIKDLGIDPTRITLDPRASIITPSHIKAETKGHLSDIGSTLQGIGECRMTKMKRYGDTIFAFNYRGEFLEVTRINIASVSPIINRALDKNQIVLCETTQGFDLCLEHGIDPIHCTSKIINPAMVMAEAGVAPSRVGDVYGVIRPCPIRVNNRTGNSGGYQEAREISWQVVARRSNYPGSHEDFGEITTTTKLPRRVFNFSWVRFDQFVQVCRPTSLCLQFANYIDWGAYGTKKWDELPLSVMDFVMLLSKQVPVNFIGTGPGHEDMIEVGLVSEGR